MSNRSRTLTWETLSPLQSDRLSRWAEAEFVLISTSDSSNVWYDLLEQVFYREHTCNGPSSWQRVTMMDIINAKIK